MEVAVMRQGKSIRLDRFLAEMKQGTRSQVKEMIRKGRVLVDGTVCRESDRKIFPDETRVLYLAQNFFGQNNFWRF